MPESKQAGDELRALEGAEVGTGSEIEVEEILRRYPQIQRYIDRRVTEAIKTYEKNRQKKDEQVPVESDAGDSLEHPATIAELVDEGRRIREGMKIENALAERGLSAFAGLIDDASQIDDLEAAAIAYLHSKNLGADFAPEIEQRSPSPLSPAEEYVARKLGLSVSAYADQKRKLQQKMEEKS